MPTSLDAFFKPKSVALIGASANKEKLGNDIMVNLIKTFKGPIYPINPKDTEVEGRPAFASILDVPETPDLAVIAIPAEAVPLVAEQCGQKGVKNIIVISAGFKESGEPGKKLEEQLSAIKDKYSLRILGPNCLGYFSTLLPINASFSASFPKKGKVAFVSQSGALMTAILDMAMSQRLGLAYFVSLGNKMDINELDLLEFLGQDKKAKVILMYLENIAAGRKFIELTRKITKVKPIIVLKAGKTERGSQAVASHTGSLAGSAQAYSAAFRQAGVIEAEDVQDFYDFTEGFAYQPLPRGNCVAIITNAGGPGVLVTDLLPAHGLQLAELSEQTKAKLKAELPAAASAHNPVDVLGDAKADRYQLALGEVINDVKVDAVIVVLTPQKMTEIRKTATVINEIRQQTDKTIVLCFMGEKEIIKHYAEFKKYSLPQYNFPLQAVKVLGTMRNQAIWQAETMTLPLTNQFTDQAKIDSARQILQKPNILESDARDILSSFGFSLHQAKVVKDENEAVAVAQAIGYPLALKVISEQIIHKSDVGGVRLGLENEADLRQAIVKMKADIARNVPQAKIDGYLLGEMVSGQQVIAGMKRDPQFGTIIMIGLGGIYTEVFKDISCRIAPLALADARKMIEELKIYPILKGARGEKPGDLEALAGLLVRLSDFSLVLPEIKEIDLNPVMVLEQGRGYKIVDTRFIM